MSWQSCDIYYRDRETSSITLAQALRRGELALLLGAGASSFLGLPSWPKLVRSCLTERKMDASRVSDTASFEELTRFAGEARHGLSEEQWQELVKGCLYPSDFEQRRTRPSDLLRAIGPMLMGSRRGCIREVWTLNYDDILEWYLRIHGFVAQVVTEPNSLLRDADVTVYHPHGYLPFDDKNGVNGRELIFDDKSYAKRAYGNDPAWRAAVQRLFRTKVVIVVGMSWTDALIKGLLSEEADHVKDRPVAFWFLDEKKHGADIFAQCLRSQVVPLLTKDHDEIPATLLRLCELAGASHSANT